MRLKRLRTRGLKGLFAFPHGDVDFDFSTLPDGLIAIVGENGSGKSTLLEAPFAAFFGSFPSRPDCTLANSVDGRDAYLDIEASFDDRGTYRARVNIDGVKGKTDALLEWARPDGTVERLNDGKVSTFHPAVAKALPSQALLLASAFAAQNKAGSFAKLDRKERRELFATLLGLERYEQMATAARAAALLVEKKLIEQRALLVDRRARASAEVEAQITETGNTLQAELSDCEAARDRIAQQLHDVQAMLEQLRARAARHVAASAERDQLELRRLDLARTMTRLQDERERIDGAFDRERLDVERRHAAAIAQLQHSLDDVPSEAQIEDTLTIALREIEATLEAGVRERQARINNNTDLIGRGAAIRAAAADVAAQQTALVEHEQLLAEAERAGRGIESVRDVAREDLQRAERAKDQRARLLRAAALLATVPCGGAGDYASCQFLQDARKAQTELDALHDVDTWHARATAELDTAQQRLTANQAQRQGCRQAIQDARAAIAKRQDDALLVAQLDAAVKRVAELQGDQATLRERAAAARQDAQGARQQAAAKATADRVRLNGAMAVEREAYEASWRSLAARSIDAIAEWAHRGEELAAALATFERQRAALDAVVAETAPAREAQTTAELREVTLRREWDDSIHRLARVHEQITWLNQRREEFRAAQESVAVLTAIVAQLETDQVAWDAFARIFGRDGLPVLEIDAAGPGVSALANDLLQACFGSRFTVELITQDMKADGKGMKEIFELRVFDAERGGEAKDLQLLSGGEQVIVDEATRAAISLFVNQRNELPIRTIFRDETTGALDPENARRYVAMLRRLLVRSGACQLFFVSHIPDAADLADAQLRIHDGRINVVYAPFTKPEAA